MTEPNNDWIQDAVAFLHSVYAPAMTSGDIDRERLANDAHYHSQHLSAAFEMMAASFEAATGEPSVARETLGHELFRLIEAFFYLGRLSADGGEEARQADAKIAAYLKRANALN